MKIVESFFYVNKWAGASPNDHVSCVCPVRNRTGGHSCAEECIDDSASTSRCTFGPFAAGNYYFTESTVQKFSRTHVLSGLERHPYRNAREISVSQTITSWYLTSVDCFIHNRFHYSPNFRFFLWELDIRVFSFSGVQWLYDQWVHDT